MNKQNDISDLSSLPNQDVSLFMLPIRGEKIIYSTPVANDSTDISANIPGLWKFLLIRIPGRGVDSDGTANPNTAAYYQFMINPERMQVNRQTLEAQSFSKGGWQFGVWGENFISIHMEGKTPGKYYDRGLTDINTPYSLSYRNLEALEVLFENNGYFFEGEQTFNGPLQSGFTHRQIKMHTDVELMVGEFIWNGMFESFSISESADQPRMATFQLEFTAWNERYRAGTPYWNPLGGNVVRGHVPGIPAQPFKDVDLPPPTIATVENPAQDEGQNNVMTGLFFDDDDPNNIPPFGS